MSVVVHTRPGGAGVGADWGQVVGWCGYSAGVCLLFLCGCSLRVFIQCLCGCVCMYACMCLCIGVSIYLHCDW